MGQQGRPAGVKNNPNRVATAMHPKLRMTWKRALKIEKIARLSADPAGYSNEQIGNMLGCTTQTVVLIRQLPEYHAKMMEVTCGITSAWDQELRQDTDNARAELASMIPSAMLVIRNALLSKNENIRLKAAGEVFDREGALAKVSKSSVTITPTPNLKIDPTVASNIMQLLAAAPITNPAGGATAIDAATGGSSVASVSFTITAKAAATQQLTMADEGLETLEELDLGAKPN